MIQLFSVCSVFFLAGGSAALASQIYTTDGSFGFQTTYQPLDAMYVSGDLDYIDSIFEIFPDADFYVVANLTWTGGESLIDLSTDGANQIVGQFGGGAFIDELIWLPPLIPGLYDIIADANENGVYDAGFDAISGAGASAAFMVQGAVPLPASIVLLGCGLVGLLGLKRKLKAQS